MVLVEVLSALLVYLSIERDESEEDTVANVLLLHSGLNKTDKEEIEPKTVIIIV